METIKKHLRIGLSLAASLFALSFILFFDFSYMGVRDAAAEKIITGSFKTIILLFNLKIMLVYGLVALFIALFSWLLRIERRGFIFLFHLFIWSWFLLRAIKVSPQLFVEPLYSKGGLLMKLQVFITDGLPLWVIYALLPLVVAADRLEEQAAAPRAGRHRPGRGLHLPLQDPRPSGPRRPAAAPTSWSWAPTRCGPTIFPTTAIHRPTPHIDGLLARGANFLNAKSSLARTFSSFTSVFTSNFPPDHQVRHMFPRPEELQLKLPTLVQALKREGYDTGMISDFAGDIFSRLGYGFDHIQAPRLSLQNLIRQRCLEFHYSLLSFLINPVGRDLFPVMWLMPLNIDPYYVTNTSKKFIRNAVQAGKPFFMVYFSSNSHFPYGSQYPYYQLYADRSYRGPHKYRKVDMMKTYSGFDLSAGGQGADRRPLRRRGAHVRRPGGGDAGTS